MLISPKCGHLKDKRLLFKTRLWSQGQPADQPCPCGAACLCSAAGKETQTAMEEKVLQTVKLNGERWIPYKLKSTLTSQTKCPFPSWGQNAMLLQIPLFQSHSLKLIPNNNLAQPVKNPGTTVDKAIKTNSPSLTALE